jgi:hypothetical protein
LAGVVIAGGSALWAVFSARRAGRAQERAEHYQARAEQQAERATKAAEHAAAAEWESAAAAKRAADALERQNRIAEEQADLAEGVPWRIEFQTGSTYDLWNDTRRPSSMCGYQAKGFSAPRPSTASTGAAPVDFMGLNAMGVGDRVEVTWHRREDQSDEPCRWSGNKPPAR